MTDKPKDGGPAFPATNLGHADSREGMTLRDWFAGQALNALAKGYRPGVGVALEAYAWADAMLSARSGEEEEGK